MKKNKTAGILLIIASLILIPFGLLGIIGSIFIIKVEIAQGNIFFIRTIPVFLLGIVYPPAGIIGFIGGYFSIKDKKKGFIDFSLILVSGAGVLLLLPTALGVYAMILNNQHWKTKIKKEEQQQEQQQPQRNLCPTCNQPTQFYEGQGHYCSNCCTFSHV